MAPEDPHSRNRPLVSEAAAPGAAVHRTCKAYRLSRSQPTGLAGTGLRFVNGLKRGKSNVAHEQDTDVLPVLGLRLLVAEAES